MPAAGKRAGQRGGGLLSLPLYALNLILLLTYLAGGALPDIGSNIGFGLRTGLTTALLQEFGWRGYLQPR
ncbi:MAG: hypothetical protein HXY40_08305 [Chloroflexi bacterium]|nr:hypothetical protein [Chloroflexota bacterium]